METTSFSLHSFDDYEAKIHVFPELSAPPELLLPSVFNTPEFNILPMQYNITNTPIMNPSPVPTTPDLTPEYMSTPYTPELDLYPTPPSSPSSPSSPCIHPSILHTSLDSSSASTSPFSYMLFFKRQPQRGYLHNNNGFWNAARALIKRHKQRSSLKRFKDEIGCVGKRICIKG